VTDELLFAVRRIASARAVVCGARRDDESPVRFCCTASRRRERARRDEREFARAMDAETNKITTKRKLRRAVATPRRRASRASDRNRASSVERRASRRAG
jgi:hypothetical protein